MLIYFEGFIYQTLIWGLLYWIYFFLFESIFKTPSPEQTRAVGKIIIINIIINIVSITISKFLIWGGRFGYDYFLKFSCFKQIKI